MVLKHRDFRRANESIDRKLQRAQKEMEPPLQRAMATRVRKWRGNSRWAQLFSE